MFFKSLVLYPIDTKTCESKIVRSQSDNLKIVCYLQVTPLQSKQRFSSILQVRKVCFIIGSNIYTVTLEVRDISQTTNCKYHVISTTEMYHTKRSQFMCNDVLN